MEIKLPGGLSLTVPNENDIDALVEHFQDVVFSQQTLRIPYPYTRQDALNFLERVKEEHALLPRAASFVIRDRGGRVIGGVGLHHIELQWARRTEIGYWLAKPYWGRGYATEAVKALCAYGHDAWGFIRIEAGVFPGNPGSAKVLEKAGFTYEGTARAFYIKSGKIMDSLRFAKILLK